MTRRMRAVAGLVLTVLLVACGSGTSNRSASTTSTSTSTSTSVPTSTSAPTTAPGHTGDEAVALVKGLYTPYAGATVDTPLVGNCFLPQTGRPCHITVSSVMTSGLIATLQDRAREGTGVDLVVCAQNTPRRVSFDSPVRTDGTAVIVVHTFYGDASSVRDQPIRVTVDLTNLKLSGLTCPSA